jgi:hypothetical protein
MLSRSKTFGLRLPRPPQPPPEFFVDRSLGRVVVAEAISAADGPVAGLEQGLRAEGLTLSPAIEGVDSSRPVEAFQFTVDV